MIGKTKIIEKQLNFYDNLPTEVYMDPEIIYLPLVNSRCKEADCFVNVGDHVNLGQIIGVRHGQFFDQNIQSTVSGIVLGTEKHWYKSGKLAEYIRIKNDMLYTVDPSIHPRTEEEIDKLTKDDFINIVKDKSIVGLGGSSFPTYVKLGTKENITRIIVDGVECEPYLNTDKRLMLNDTDKLIKGIKYIQKFYNNPKATIAIKEKYHDIYDHLKKALEGVDNIEVVCVGNFYPQGWEIAMINSVTGIKVKPGTLPAKYGVLTFNVSTVVSIYNAIKEDISVLYRHITINGDGIANPKNFKVRVGTNVRELIARCGGYKDGHDKVVIVGGPMMGTNMFADDIIVTKTLTGVLVMDKREYTTSQCVRCASCVYSCPQGLRPVDIMNAYKRKDVDALKELNVKSCIQCGLCSYTCTSKIELTDFMIKAKKMVG